MVGDKVIYQELYQELPARAVTCKARTRPFVMEPQVNVNGLGLPEEVDLSVVGQATYVSHRRQPLRKALDERTGGVECLVARPDGPGPALISRCMANRPQSGQPFDAPCRSRPPYRMDGNRRFLDRMLGCARHAIAHRCSCRRARGWTAAGYRCHQEHGRRALTNHRSPSGCWLRLRRNHPMVPTVVVPTRMAGTVFKPFKAMYVALPIHNTRATSPNTCPIRLLRAPKLRAFDSHEIRWSCSFSVILRIRSAAPGNTSL